MPRRHAAHIPFALSRKLERGFIKKPPPAYAVIINHPPGPSLVRQPVNRAEEDLPLRLRPSNLDDKSVRRALADRKPRPMPIEYPALDALRRAFYRDHPFEAYRPMSLMEGGSAGGNERIREVDKDECWIGGNVGERRWTLLHQKTKRPSADEWANFPL